MRRQRGNVRSSTSCTAATCPQPLIGACCYAASPTRGAYCSVVAQTNCTSNNGTFAGANVTCQAAACPASCPCDWDHDCASGFCDLDTHTCD